MQLMAAMRDPSWLLGPRVAFSGGVPGIVCSSHAAFNPTEMFLIYISLMICDVDHFLYTIGHLFIFFLRNVYSNHLPFFNHIIC
jgi:hypothetical protein